MGDRLGSRDAVGVRYRFFFGFYGYRRLRLSAALAARSAVEGRRPVSGV